MPGWAPMGGLRGASLGGTDGRRENRHWKMHLLRCFCLLLPEGKGLLERDTSSPAASRAEPLPPIFLSCGAGEHLTLALRNLKNTSRGVI